MLRVNIGGSDMKRVLLLLIIFLSCSCGSKRAVLQDEKSSNTIHEIVSEHSEVDNTTKFDVVNRVITSNDKDNSVTSIKEVEYSIPDDQGMQYIIKEVIKEIKSNTESNWQDTTELISELKKEISRLKSDNRRLKSDLQSKTKERVKVTSKVPIWSYIVVFIIGAIISLVARKWMIERYRLLRDKAS